MLMNANSNKLARIAINKSCLKEYSTSLSERTVYLNNGSEFQIQLFNPHNYKIACRISIDGKEFPNQIMLKPGQRIWLERYIDIAKKFKFSTYEVEANNKQVDSAIRDNGVVSIKFYAEDRNCASIIKYVTDSPIIRDTIYDYFTTDTYKVVGIMHTPYYLSQEKGTSDIGGGSVQYYAFIPAYDFDMFLRIIGIFTSRTAPRRF